MAPRMDESSGTSAFSHLVFGFMMTGTKHKLLIKFLKIKPPIFLGIESINVFEFIIDCYGRLHKMGDGYYEET